MAPTDPPRAILLPMHSDVNLRSAETSTQDDGSELHMSIPPTHSMGSSFYVLASDECVIGRDPLCDICIAGHRTDISRRHAMIRRENDGYVIYDMSTYGTFVNRQRVTSQRLDSEDIIGLANSLEVLRFVHDCATEETPSLSERELNVLRLVSAGRLNKEIANELGIALNTVNTHLKSIYGKLSVHNRTEAVDRARRRHLL